MICANLLGSVLVAECGGITAWLEPGGILLAAGILQEEFAEVQRAYEQRGLKLHVSSKTGEWRSGAFRKLT